MITNAGAPGCQPPASPPALALGTSKEAAARTWHASQMGADTHTHTHTPTHTHTHAHTHTHTRARTHTHTHLTCSLRRLLGSCNASLGFLSTQKGLHSKHRKNSSCKSREKMRHSPELLVSSLHETSSQCYTASPCPRDLRREQLL